MNGSRLLRKLAFTIIAPIVIGLMAVAFVSQHSYRQDLKDYRQHQGKPSREMESLALVLRHALADGWTDTHESVEPLVEQVYRETGIQTTVLDVKGSVLASTTGDHSEAANLLDATDIRSAAQQALGHAQVTVNGEEMTYVSTRIDRGTQHLGFLRLSRKTATLNAGHRRHLRDIILAVTITSLLAAGWTYWNAKRIIEPIGAITSAAQQLSHGERMEPMSFQRDDELGTLADALRRMDVQFRAREGKVRDTSELLSTVLEGMTEGILAVDSGGRILFANPAAESILGVPTERAAGKPLTEVTRNPVLRSAVTQAMGRSPNSTNHDEQTTEMVSEAIPGRAFLLNASRLDGDPCPGVVVAFHDVSEIRRLEQMRQEFVSNVSHELKTPLSCIKAYAETLRAGAVDDASVNREFLSRIEEQSDRLNDLILDMIRLARVESGQQAFDIVSVSMSEIIDVAFHRHRTLATERNVQLHCDAELPDVKVRADEEGLQQIFDNLIDNAVKYSRENGNVYVSWQTSGNEVFISVKDDGLGIKHEDINRVFERFYRVDKARSSEIGSTGLGLSIVKHMARAFGGGVSLDSKYGQGSTFRVRLPKA